jgi:hypothetical protein
MNNLSVRKFFLLLFVLSFTVASCNVRIFHRNPEKQLFSKTRHIRKEIKVKEPRKVLGAKKKQEANDKKLQRKSEKSIKLSRKRTVDIQTPEVQARMKQDKNNMELRDKESVKKKKKKFKKP